VTDLQTSSVMNEKNFPFIKTDRLLLRQFTSTDIDNVFEGLSNPNVIKFYGVSYHSLEATRTQMKFFSDLEEHGTGIWWAVCSMDDKVFYGAAGLNSLSKQHKKAEIGFWLLPPFWGKGIMTEAIPLICNYGFDHLKLHRIEGIVETENINSKKILTKLEFQHEGTMKECEVKNEKFISLDIYAKFETSAL
jgi:[ribosomal protein S5]-alanine N-acetyltransferase